MMLRIVEIAAAIVLARVIWSILPALVGAAFTVLLAVLAPVTAIKYLMGRRRAVQAPPVVQPPFSAKAVVAKYMAEYAKRDETQEKG